jgi:hypothetical protein
MPRHLRIFAEKNGTPVFRLGDVRINALHDRGGSASAGRFSGRAGSHDAMSDVGCSRLRQLEALTKPGIFAIVECQKFGASGLLAHTLPRQRRMGRGVHNDRIRIPKGLRAT